MSRSRSLASLRQCLRSATLCLLLVLAGCTPNSDKVLQIGTNLWIGYEPLFLARSLNFFSDRIRLVEFTTASDALRAFRSGVIDGATLTLDEALLLAQDQIDIKIVLVLDTSLGGDTLLGQPQVKSLQELRGRRIGVENSALGAFMLTRALQHSGLTSQDIQVVPLGHNAHERAFQEKSVDAVVTYEPVSTKLKAVGATILFDSSQIPNEIVDVLVVRASFLKENPAIVTEVRQAWFKSVRHLEEQPRESARLMQDRQAVSSPEGVLAMFNGLKLYSFQENQGLLNGGQGSLVASGARLVEIMLAEKLLHRPVQLAPLLAKFGEDGS